MTKASPSAKRSSQDSQAESARHLRISFSATHLQHALAPSGVSPAGTHATRSLPQRGANPSPHHFETIAGNPHLFYGVRDRADGVLLIDLYLEPERATIGRFFGQSYLSIDARLLPHGAAAVRRFSLRYYLRTLIGLPEDERRTRSSTACAASCTAAAICCRGFWSCAGDLRRRHHQHARFGGRHRLPARGRARSVLEQALAHHADRHDQRAADADRPILSPYDANWWSYLESHSVAVFAIFATGFFGSANMRKSQAEALALAEAVRSRAETADLRERWSAPKPRRRRTAAWSSAYA